MVICLCSAAEADGATWLIQNDAALRGLLEDSVGMIYLLVELAYCGLDHLNLCVSANSTSFSYPLDSAWAYWLMQDVDNTSHWWPIQLHSLPRLSAMRNFFCRF